MIRAQNNAPSSSVDISYAYLNTSSGIFESTLPAPAVGTPEDAIIYKTDTTEFPIFVGQATDTSNMVVISAGPGIWAANITNTGLHQAEPFIIDNVLVVITDTNKIYNYFAVSLKS